jgi:hypothetical protein
LSALHSGRLAGDAFARRQTCRPQLAPLVDSMDTVWRGGSPRGRGQLVSLVGGTATAQSRERPHRSAIQATAGDIPTIEVVQTMIAPAGHGLRPFQDPLSRNILAESVVRRMFCGWCWVSRAIIRCSITRRRFLVVRSQRDPRPRGMSGRGYPL